MKVGARLRTGRGVGAMLHDPAKELRKLDRARVTCPNTDETAPPEQRVSSVQNRCRSGERTLAQARPT